MERRPQSPPSADSHGQVAKIYASEGRARCAPDRRHRRPCHDRPWPRRHPALPTDDVSGQVHRLSGDRQVAVERHTIRAPVHSEETTTSNTGDSPRSGHWLRPAAIPLDPCPASSLPRGAGRSRGSEWWPRMPPADDCSRARSSSGGSLRLRNVTARKENGSAPGQTRVCGR
jgi:hypothetical protein